MAGLDGSVLFGGSNTTSISGSLTTTQAHDVIVVTVETNGACNNVTVSDTAGLTWTQRGNTGGGSRGQVNFWAHATAALSADTITVTEPSGQYLVAIAFAVSGAATPTAPFDANASLPATSASGAVSISTTAANTFAFGCYRGSSGISHGAGWTAIQTGTYILAEYQTLSAPAAGLSVTFTGTANGGIGDAIVLGGSTPTTLAPASGIALASGAAPSIVWGTTLHPAAGLALASGIQPSVTYGTTLQPGPGLAAAAGGAAPTVAWGVTLQPSPGAAIASGLAPTVTWGTAVAPPVGSAVALGTIPVVNTSGGDITLYPSAGAAYASGIAPSVSNFLLGPITTVPAETYITTIPAETYITTVPA